MPKGDADRIRTHLCQLVEHARSGNEPRFSVAAGEIRVDLGLNHANAIIDICQVLDTQQFRAAAGVEFLCRAGPSEGVDTVFLFNVLKSGQVIEDKDSISRKHAKYGIYFLEHSVLSVLREASTNYLGPAEISRRTKIYGDNLKIKGKEKVTSHSIVEGILAKLYSDGRLDYKYQAGWRLKNAEAGGFPLEPGSKDT